MNQKIYFITYGTSNFKIAKKHLTMLAEKFEIFDEIYNLGPNNLSNDFKKDFKSTLAFKKGGGYWIWKHEIINQTLNQVKKGDLVVYCDAGSSLNFNAKKRLTEYIEMLNDSTFSHFRFESEQKHIEKFWTTKELFNYFNISLNSEISNSVQFEAGHMIFKNNNETKKYFETYKKTLLDDINLITDIYNENPQIDQFIENRHDQSIFSLLSKIYGCVNIKNETQFKNNPEQQYDYPFLSVRTYGHKYKDKLKMYLRPKKYFSNPVYFQ